MALFLAPEVRRELDEIWSYIAGESGSIEVADAVIEVITQRCSLLADHPYAGRRRDEDLRPGVRSFPAGEYVIFYRIKDKDIWIVHILHGRRDIGAVFEAEG